MTGPGRDVDYSKTAGPVPLHVGDAMIFRDRGADIPVRVILLDPWTWILVEAEDGRRWLEAVVDVSATSFDVIVQLAETIEPKDRHEVDRIARQINDQMGRLDRTIEGVLAMCHRGDGYALVRSDEADA